jgi:hypothetical protein
VTQPDLFYPATWLAPLPIGPWVKRPWKKPSYVIEVREHPRPHIGPVDPHLPLGACCVYRLTNIKTGKAYIGKTVWSLEKYIGNSLTSRKKGIIGRALRKPPDRAAFRSEIILVGSEDYCFRDVIDGERGGMERKLIEAYSTLSPNGYNLTSGGEGFTSEDARRSNSTPESKTARARVCEHNARKAGYPQRRVLAELEKGPRRIASMEESLRLTWQQVHGAMRSLIRNGHHIIWERTSPCLYRLIPLEEAADHWASGREVTIAARMLGLLMGGPRTLAELMAFLGVNNDTVRINIRRLRGCLDFTVLGCKIRRPGYDIECRLHRRLKGQGRRLYAYHLIIDHKRHPWLHLGAMDWRASAHDDRE